MVRNRTTLQIVRTPRPESGYSQVSHTITRDKSLTRAARGLLIELLSYPNDWRTDFKTLARNGPEGESAVRKMLSDLRKAGYIVQVKTQDARGRWSTQNLLFDVPQVAAEVNPQVAPSVGKPGVGEPKFGEPTPIRRTETEEPDEESASKQASTPLSAQDEDSASPAPPPTPRIPNPRGWTDWRAEDRILWEQTLEDLDDYTPAELDEIYVHWCQRFDWPGKFAESMATDRRLDGFLGGSGIDLGLYDEADEPVDPWATSA